MDKVKVKTEKSKRGTVDRGLSITSLAAALLLLVSVVGGCGKSDVGTGGESSGKPDSTSTTKESEQVDTLVVKGLYIGQKVDDAIEACKKVATSSEDLIVVDFRNGIEVEREVGLGEYEKKQEDALGELGITRD